MPAVSKKDNKIKGYPKCHKTKVHFECRTINYSVAKIEVYEEQKKMRLASNADLRTLNYTFI